MRTIDPTTPSKTERNFIERAARKAARRLARLTAIDEREIRANRDMTGTRPDRLPMSIDANLAPGGRLVSVEINFGHVSGSAMGSTNALEMLAGGHIDAAHADLEFEIERAIDAERSAMPALAA